MAKLVDLFDGLDMDAQLNAFLREANETRAYAKKIKSAFNHLTPEGQAVIAILAESMSKNPEYHEDYEDENGNPFPPPDDIWIG